MAKSVKAAEVVAVAKVVLEPVVVPRWEVPAVPSWERARGLLGTVRQTAQAIVLLGMEIDALRDQFFSPGSRTDLTSTARGGGSEKGWEAVVKEQLCISPSSARRLIEKARYVCMIETVMRGEFVEYTDSRNKLNRLEATEEVQRMAGILLEDVVAGTASPQRAWAGIVGESSRRASGAGPNRAAVDHSKNIEKALVKLRTSLASWKHLDIDQRGRLEQLWDEIADSLPDTWRMAQEAR